MLTPSSKLEGRGAEASAPPRTLPRATLVAVVASVAVCAAISAARGHFAIPDDVYFYLKIADSIVQGEGSTFNGLQPTNGYHPLWMLVCIAERALVGPGHTSRILAHLAVSGLLSLAAVVATWVLSGQVTRARVGLGAALFGAFLCRNHLGSELHASAPMLVLTLLWTLRMRREARRGQDDAVLGMLLGLTTLARLDNVFVCMALGLAGTWPRDREGWPRAALSAALAAGVAAAVLAPYLTWNVATFGHLVPVSGAVKAALAQQRSALFPRLGAQGSILIVASLISPLFWLKAPCRPRVRGTMLALSLGAAVHGLYTAFFAHAVWTWYFVAEALTLSLTLEAALHWLPERRRLRTPVVAAMAAVALGMAVTYEVATRAKRPAWYLEVAALIDREVPEGGVVVTSASPGSLAYFSHRSVFALDGLTGNFTWFEEAERDGLYEALRDLGATHLLSPGPRSSELPRLIRRTRATGHGGESPAFEGRISTDGTAQATTVGLFDPFVGRHVGWLRADTSNLVGQSGPARAMGLWRLQEAPNPSPAQRE